LIPCSWASSIRRSIGPRPLGCISSSTTKPSTRRTDGPEGWGYTR
jgi:hypothetical protein